MSFFSRDREYDINISSDSEPEEKYDLRPHSFRFCCTITPYVSCESALKQARKETRTQNQALSDTYSPEYVRLFRKISTAYRGKL